MTDADIFLLEQAVWLATAPTRVPAYDFDFSTFFELRRPWERKPQIEAIGRFGAASDYSSCYYDFDANGVSLVHTPEMHNLCSELPEWYPLIEAFTPYSRWFEKPPSVDQIEACFQWPVFVKGSRQTSRHRADLAIIQSPDHYEAAIREIANDPILGWQRLVIREYLSLRPVGGNLSGKIPAAFEFRTFWWRGKCVGEGRYHTSANYGWSATEQVAAMAVARAVVACIDATFLVVDLAQTIDGQWRVIELNDGQESGYAGVPPTAVWQNIIAIERDRTQSAS